MSSRLNLTYHDYDDEVAQTSFRGVELTAANFDAQDALMNAVRDAVEAVSLGKLNKVGKIASEASPYSGPADSAQAQREMKWLVRMYDAVTGATVNVQIPCPDFSLLEENSNRMDPTSDEYIALVAAIEDFHLSVAENAVEVIDVILIGRNL
jgi:hypothetical protein